MTVCCFPNCTTAVTKPHVTCPHHWYSLPSRIQVAVQERIRAWKRPDEAREYIVNWYKTSIKKGPQQ
jgi:hypothetical protein